MTRKRVLWVVITVTIMLSVFAIYWKQQGGYPDGGSDPQSGSARPSGSATQFDDTELEADEDSSRGPTDLAAEEYPPVKFLTNSLYPHSLYDVFAANYEKAHDGDVESQYLLYRVFSECEGVRSDPEVRAEVLRILDDPNITADFNFRLERCEKIQGSHKDFLAEKRHWYTRAYENGHPLIVAWQEVMYNDDRTVAHNALMNALETGSYEAYDAAALYIGMKGTGQMTDQTAEQSDPWLYSACQNSPGCDLSSYEMKITIAAEPWNFLSCSKNPGCNSGEYLAEVLAPQYGDSTSQAIVDRAAELEILVEQGRIDELGL